MIHIVAFDYLKNVDMENVIWIAICIIMIGFGVLYHAMITKIIDLVKYMLWRKSFDGVK